MKTIPTLCMIVAASAMVACEHSRPAAHSTSAFRSVNDRPYNVETGRFEDPVVKHRTSPGDASR